MFYHFSSTGVSYDILGLSIAHTHTHTNTHKRQKVFFIFVSPVISRGPAKTKDFMMYALN